MNIKALTACCVLLLIICPALAGYSAGLPAPEPLASRGINLSREPLRQADAFLGLAYRPDGVIDEQGRYTQFEHPEKIFDTPGLNCSGLTLSLSRFLLGRNIGLKEAARDRLDDSGPGSALGQDWDYGFDLILNISQGLPRRVVPSSLGNPDLEKTGGKTLRGFDLNDPAAWAKALAEIKPGKVYLASFSKTVKDKGYELKHYHVGVILADSKGGIWLYQALPRSGVTRRNLAAADGLAGFSKDFKESVPGRKMILILELTP